MMRVVLDTNILVYAAGVERHADDARKIALSQRLIELLPSHAQVVVPLQVLGELYMVLTRSGEPRDEARAAVLRLVDTLKIVEGTRSGFVSALELATDHKLQFWDALILNAAAEAGCTMLLSEDMAEGFSWRGTVVTNPLAETLDPRLARLLA